VAEDTNIPRVGFKDGSEQRKQVGTDAPMPMSATSSSVSGLSTYESADFENDAVIKASGGVLYSCDGFSTIAGFLLFFDSVTVPANSTVPKHAQPIGLNEPFSYDPPGPINYSTGISFAISSTINTLTLIPTNEALMYAYYI